MTDMVNIRQSTADVRAAAKFVRSGNVWAWTPDVDKPDVINNDADFEKVRDNVSAGIRIVKAYGADGGSFSTYNWVCLGWHRIVGHRSCGDGCWRVGARVGPYQGVAASPRRS